MIKKTITLIKDTTYAYSFKKKYVMYIFDVALITAQYDNTIANLTQSENLLCPLILDR